MDEVQQALEALSVAACKQASHPRKVQIERLGFHGFVRSVRRWQRGAKRVPLIVTPRLT